MNTTNPEKKSCSLIHDWNKKKHPSLTLLFEFKLCGLYSMEHGICFRKNDELLQHTLTITQTTTNSSYYI